MESIKSLETVAASPTAAFHTVAEAWVVSESPLWRTWAGSVLEERGYEWRSVGWDALESLAAGEDWVDVVLTDGSRDLPAVANLGKVIEAGENLGDPWDAPALEKALEAHGVVVRGRNEGGDAVAMVATDSSDHAMGRWYLQAGRQALGEIEENLRQFVDAQSGPLHASDYLNEAREAVRRMGDLNDAYAAGLDVLPVLPGENALWPAVEAAFDLACLDSGLHWEDQLPAMLPDVAMARWPMEKALEALLVACQIATDDAPAVVSVTARERAVKPWRQVELEVHGLPGPDSVAALAPAMLDLAARMSAAGGRFELAPSGEWRCVFPVRPSAALRSRSAAPRLRRVLVVASDTIESSILCQMVWRKGMLPVPARTVAGGAHHGAHAPAGRGFDAAIIADGPGVSPDENAIFLGLMMPMIVLAMEEDDGERWLDVPGVSRVLGSPASPTEAIAELDGVWAE